MAIPILAASGGAGVATALADEGATAALRQPQSKAGSTARRLPPAQTPSRSADAAFNRLDTTAALAAAAADRPDHRIALSTRLRMLETVDQFVNAHVTQATDQEVYGVAEYWTRSGTGRHARGDCEDLAIEKRLELEAQGYPARDLFYAVGYRTDLGLHAVLIAHTELGDLVLDSLTDAVALWNHTPYTWVKRQSPQGRPTWALAARS